MLNQNHFCNKYSRDIAQANNNKRLSFMEILFISIYQMMKNASN